MVAGQLAADIHQALRYKVTAMPRPFGSVPQCQLGYELAPWKAWSGSLTTSFQIRKGECAYLLEVN